MRAIPVNEESLKWLRKEKEATRHLLRVIKNSLALARAKGSNLYYIPEYEFPEAAGIPREHVVDDAFLYRYFEVGTTRDDMVWIHIRPRFIPMVKTESMDES